MRTVDADAIISRIKPLIEAEQQIFKKGSWRFAEKCLAVVESTPTVDAERKGHWKNAYALTEYRYRCSECFANHRARYDYCPSCGARMEVE